LEPRGGKLGCTKSNLILEPIPRSTRAGCRCRSWPSCAQLTKHRDVREVSLRSDAFSSAAKSIAPRYWEDLAAGQIEAGRASMIMMDDPEHGRLRKTTARGFTPRAVERLRPDFG
jgi:cytochrome P450